MSFNKDITINGGGEESGYPIENLEDGNWNTTWMNALDTEEVTIDMDFGSSAQPTSLILGNHNLTDINYGIKLQNGTGGVGGSFSGDEWLIGSGVDYENYTASDEDLWVESLNPSNSRQYYRLTIENKNGVKPEIGVFIICIKYTMGLNYSLGASLGKFYGTEKRITTGGQQKSNQLHGAKNRFQLSFDDIDETDKGYFDSIMDEIQGSLYPFVFTDIDGTHYYVRKQEENNFHDLVEYQIYNKQWILVEEN